MRIRVNPCGSVSDFMQPSIQFRGSVLDSRLMKILKKVLFRLMEPPGAKLFRKEFGKRPFRLLDVGSGNHAATTFTRMFPGCSYFGIDRMPDYGNDENDLAAMTQFWQMDLTQLAFDQIPDLYFDAINLTHIIEHLHNGDLVIVALLKKLRRGGVVYLEYPRLFSTRLPHMRETLNFFDDEPHCRIYSLG